MSSARSRIAAVSDHLLRQDNKVIIANRFRPKLPFGLNVSFTPLNPLTFLLKCASIKPNHIAIECADTGRRWTFEVSLTGILRNPLINLVFSLSFPAQKSDIKTVHWLDIGMGNESQSSSLRCSITRVAIGRQGVRLFPQYAFLRRSDTRHRGGGSYHYSCQYTTNAR